jgi:hypothetical protein
LGRFSPTQESLLRRQCGKVVIPLGACFQGEDFALDCIGHVIDLTHACIGSWIGQFARESGQIARAQEVPREPIYLQVAQRNGVVTPRC